MSRIHGCCVAVAAGLLISIAAFPAGARTPAATGSSSTQSTRRSTIAKFYRSYFFSAGYTSVGMVLCGSTISSEGCYGSANLGPFGHAGALLEGKPETLKRGVTTRNLYIVDDKAGAGKGVTLDIYKETVTVDAPFATLTITPTNTIALPLTGGTGANTYIAADNRYLFIGTDQSPFAVMMDKFSLAFGEVGGFSPPMNVSAITADDKGYVTITFGSTGGMSGFYAFDPDGFFVEDGGGADYFLNSSNGFSTGEASTTSMIVKPRLKVRLAHVRSQSASGS